MVSNHEAGVFLGQIHLTAYNIGEVQNGGGGRKNKPLLSFGSAPRAGVQDTPPVPETCIISLCPL